ncbi:hypothetical protein DPZ15_00290 [Klebsiella pneumoniae]|nr:hypothetical protein DPZ15_00290 [Klebsiella pneumoniae]
MNSHAICKIRHFTAKILSVIIAKTNIKLFIKTRSRKSTCEYKSIRVGFLYEWVCRFYQFLITINSTFFCPCAWSIPFIPNLVIFYITIMTHNKSGIFSKSFSGIVRDGFIPMIIKTVPIVQY